MKYFLVFGIILLLQLQPAKAQNRPEQMPVYPGCEQADKKMACFKEKLLEFITENFNSDLINAIKDTDEISMLVIFVIDETGKPVDMSIQSAYPKLNDEMKRVLQLLPDIKPAKTDNYPIRMQYELPLVFEPKSDKKQE
jgi:protein TonB